MLGNRFVFTIVAASFLFVSISQAIAAPGGAPKACAELFDSVQSAKAVARASDAVVDAHFEKILTDGKLFTAPRPDDVKKAFTNHVDSISETTKMFPVMGPSISRLFLKFDVQYAPLHVLLGIFESPRRKMALVEKFFRSGYRLSKGSKKYPDTGDIDALMQFSSAEPLAIAIASSEENRQILRDYFILRPINTPAWSHIRGVSPLETNVVGPDYDKVVIEKLVLLKSVQADLTSVLEGVASPAWRSAKPEQRVNIVSRLPFELGAQAALNHQFRETDTVSAGVTALLYAITERDLPLIDIYRKYGAEADVVIPEQTDSATIEQMKWPAGETIRAYAKSLKVKLPY